jgi:hypothetical protein
MQPYYGGEALIQGPKLKIISNPLSPEHHSLDLENQVQSVS